jgi:hypothetical protein
VLITGGVIEASQVGYQPFASSAELYDPRTGTFSPTGSLNVARAAASAAKLPDGRVLIVGGWNGQSDIASAELFDATTGVLSPTASLNEARVGAMLVVLQDGKVLVAGGMAGVSPDIDGLSSAETYSR